MKRRKLVHHGFPGKLKTCSGKESMTCFHNLMFDGSTVSLTVLAMTPWDFRPRKCSSDSLFCEALKMEEAPIRSRLSNNESARILGWFVTSQSSLMLAFLLDLRRCLLVSFSLAALCAKVGIPSPQKLLVSWPILSHMSSEETQAILLSA